MQQATKTDCAKRDIVEIATGHLTRQHQFLMEGHTLLQLQWAAKR